MALGPSVSGRAPLFLSPAAVLRYVAEVASGTSLGDRYLSSTFAVSGSVHLFAQMVFEARWPEVARVLGLDRDEAQLVQEVTEVLIRAELISPDLLRGLEAALMRQAVMLERGQEVTETLLFLIANGSTDKIAGQLGDLDWRGRTCPAVCWDLYIEGRTERSLSNVVGDSSGCGGAKWQCEACRSCIFLDGQVSTEPWTEQLITCLRNYNIKKAVITKQAGIAGATVAWKL